MLRFVFRLVVGYSLLRLFLFNSVGHSVGYTRCVFGGLGVIRGALLVISL